MAEFVIEMIFGILEIATAIIENDSKNKNN